MATYKLGTRSKNNLIGVHPLLVKLVYAAISDSPVDFTVVEGVRLEATQKMYYSWGRTKINPNTDKMTIVTNADGVKKKSNHQVKEDGYGHAIDIYPFFLGKVQVNHPDTITKLKQIADHFKIKAAEMGISITWGGDWKNPYDPPHIQINL